MNKINGAKSEMRCKPFQRKLQRKYSTLICKFSLKNPLEPKHIGIYKAQVLLEMTFKFILKFNDQLEMQGQLEVQMKMK